MGKVRIALVIGLLIAGILVMVYPSASNYINTLHASSAVQRLSEQLSRTDSSVLEEQRLLAEEYNRALLHANPEPVQGYAQIMDFGNGIMGSIQIPDIDVELSIGHGVSDAVLQTGVGHLPGSSLPIGGAGTHCVLTGHTGLPSAELFTDLIELDEGDRFYLMTLGRTLGYEVDRITVVLPHEVDALVPEEGRDLCTLVTCTPYGINSHRLLVRGTRIPDAETVPATRSPSLPEEALRLPPELVCAAAAIAGLLILAVFLLLRRERPQATEGGA